MQRHAIAPGVIAYTGAIRVRVKGRQHQQNIHLFRALRRHAIVLGGFTYTAATSVCGVGQQYLRALHLYRRCGAMLSCRM